MATCDYETRRRCRIVWIVILVLLLIGVGLAVYFFYPRTPTVSGHGLTVRRFAMSPGAGNATLSGGNATLDFTVELLVTNDNWIEVAVERLVLSMFAGDVAVARLATAGEHQVPRNSDSAIAVAQSLVYAQPGGVLSLGWQLGENGGFVNARFLGVAVFHSIGLGSKTTVPIDVTYRMALS